MSKHQPFSHLKGSSAYYPFYARTALRRRQRIQSHILRSVGIAAVLFSVVVGVRQFVFRGGQPRAPVATVGSVSPAITAVPTTAPTPLRLEPRAATVDALAQTEQSDLAAHQSPAPQPTPADGTLATILPQYQDLYEKNSDFVGWLRMEGTNIDYPVVQIPNDNSYYLRRGFDRFYSPTGTLFLDGRCTMGESSSTNWLIYGHNVMDGSMFGTLTAYEDETFYREHPTFTFDTLTETGTWQVFAALHTRLGADALPYYAFFDASNRAEWQEWVNAICELSLYDTGVSPQYGDQLLTLSTCGAARSGTDERFAVLAVRVA